MMEYYVPYTLVFPNPELDSHGIEITLSYQPCGAILTIKFTKKLYSVVCYQEKFDKVCLEFGSSQVKLELYIEDSENSYMWVEDDLEIKRFLFIKPGK